MTVSRGRSNLHTRPVVALEWAAWFATLPYLFAVIIIVMTSWPCSTPLPPSHAHRHDSARAVESDSRPVTYRMRPASAEALLFTLYLKGMSMLEWMYNFRINKYTIFMQRILFMQYNKSNQLIKYQNWCEAPSFILNKLIHNNIGAFTMDYKLNSRRK